MKREARLTAAIGALSFVEHTAKRGDKTGLEFVNDFMRDSGHKEVDADDVEWLANHLINKCKE